MKNNQTKVIIPCRFSYQHCWEPVAINNSEPKYSVSAVIPKSDTKTVEAIKAAVEQAKDSAQRANQRRRYANGFKCYGNTLVRDHEGSRHHHYEIQ